MSSATVSILKKIGIGFCSLIALLVVFVITYYFIGEYYMFSQFKSKANTAQAIPGLDKKYTPQGMWVDSENEVYLYSGYMSDDTPSRIYVQTKEETKYLLLKVDGKDFFGHVGGICSVNDYIYLASEKTVYTFLKNDALTLDNGNYISNISYFIPNLNCSFIYEDGTYLYVGEFYKPKSYETDPSHHIQTNDGTNKALVRSYTLNEDGSIGELVNTYSIPNKIQGICITPSNKIVLSQSYGIANSHLIIYDLNKASVENGITILDSRCFVDDVSCYPMSEALDYDNGKVYILFESAAKKYRLFNLFAQENVLTYDIQ